MCNDINCTILMLIVEHIKDFDSQLLMPEQHFALKLTQMCNNNIQAHDAD